MEAVAAGDEIALDLVHLAALVIAQLRMIVGQAVQAHVLGLVDHGRPLRRVRVHQVFLDLGLAVDGDALAAQRLQIDAQPPPVEGQLQALVDQPLAREPGAEAGVGQHVDRALLEQSGAHAGAQIRRRPPLQDDDVDALETQQPCQ